MRSAAATGLLAALLLAGCGGGTAGGGTMRSAGSDQPAAAALRPCEVPSAVTRTTLVEGDGRVPPDAELEELVASSGNPDLAFMVDQREQDGMTRSAALAEAWIQLGGERVLAEARELPGFVQGAYGSLERDEPFRLDFAGSPPPALDAIASDRVVRAVGLDVVAGASSPGDLLPDAMEAAREAGLRAVGGHEEPDGTVVVEVIAAPGDRVARWEQLVDDPRACLAIAPAVVPCDDRVVADARSRADPDRPMLPATEPAPPDPARAEQVRRSYLGLTLEEARAKAAEEGRALRVVVEEGVPLGTTDDLLPGRLGLTLCSGVVVDTELDLEEVEE